MAEVPVYHVKVDSGLPAALHPSWLSYPTPYPELSNPGGSAVLLYLIQPFWLLTLFVPLASWLHHMIPLPSPPQFPHGLAQSGHDHSGLSQMSPPLTMR